MSSFGQFGNAIVGGAKKLIRQAIQSPGYVAAVQGWSINKDGSAEFSNVTLRGSLQAGGDGTAGHPGTTYNATIPASLSTYYAAGNTTTITAPETVIDVNLSSDGAGTQVYDALVIDSSTPKVTSLVTGTIVAGVVTEWSRTWMDAQPVLGTAAKFGAFFENTKLIVNTGTDVDAARILIATATSGDTVDGWNVDARGKQKWGPGGATAPDTTLYRSGVGVLAADPIKANVAGAAETWHAVVFQNSWVNSGGTDVTCQYRLVAAPASCVQLVGSMKNGTHVNGTTVFNLPAGYRPAHKILVPVSTQGTAAAGSDSPRFELNTNGDVTIVGCATGAIFFSILFPLDA